LEAPCSGVSSSRFLAVVAAAWPVEAQAQQAGKQYRIGMLETTGEAVKTR